MAKRKKSRRRSPTKKRRRRSRSTKSRRKPKQMGMLGRIGAFTAGALPPALAGTTALGSTMAFHKGGRKPNIMSSASFFMVNFVNNITVGLFGVPAIETMSVTSKDGQTSKTSGDLFGLPKFSLAYTIGAGLSMMAADSIASFLNKGRAVKIPFTNYNAIGSS